MTHGDIGEMAKRRVGAQRRIEAVIVGTAVMLVVIAFFVGEVDSERFGMPGRSGVGVEAVKRLCGSQRRAVILGGERRGVAESRGGVETGDFGIVARQCSRTVAQFWGVPTAANQGRGRGITGWRSGDLESAAGRTAWGSADMGWRPRIIGYCPADIGLSSAQT